DIEELQDELAKHCIELPETFVGDIQEVVEVDAGLEDAKWLWLKNGSSTGWTAGPFLSKEAKRFIRTTVVGFSDNPARDPPDLHPENIISARVCVFKMKSEKGDSGSEVVRVKGDGFALGA